MEPTWGSSGANRTQVGPMLAHELCYLGYSASTRLCLTFLTKLLYSKHLTKSQKISQHFTTFSVSNVELWWHQLQTPSLNEVLQQQLSVKSNYWSLFDVSRFHCISLVEVIPIQVIEGIFSIKYFNLCRTYKVKWGNFGHFFSLHVHCISHVIWCWIWMVAYHGSYYEL